MKKYLYKLLSVFAVICFLFYTMLTLISLSTFQTDSLAAIFEFWILIMVICLLIINSFFLVKGVFNQFNNLKNNYILLTNNFLIIILLNVFMNYAIGVFHAIFGGWTAYPPLSALPDNTMLIMRNKYGESMLFLWASQIILLVIIVFISVKIGKLIAGKYKA